MEQRILGKTGRNVSVVGLGTWQLGADWGDVDPAQAQAILAAAVEAGVTFGWGDIVGSHGKVVGLDRFGASAPGEVLYENLGITVAAVVAAAKSALAAS